MFNYGNRNATTNYTNQDIAKSYSIAVTSSIFVALSIRKAFELSGITKGLTGPRLIFFNSFSSFFACMSAGYINLFAMRQSELKKGIEITDDNGKILGKSVVVAKKAVLETATSRIVLALLLFFPALGLIALEKLKLMPR